MQPRIPLTVPSIDSQELAEIAKVLESGYLTQGPAVASFEKAVADYVGVKYAFATTSATTALHLSLVALDIAPRSEVIVPAFTFPATANVVIQHGAVPVLADIDPDTFAVSTATLEAVITDSTSAIMPVDPFGYPVDMKAVVALATDHSLHVVEDAACAIGAVRSGRQCGSFRDVGCFSFHPRKVITTGEGGMITTDDDAIADRISILRNHGGVRKSGRSVFVDAGFNYRMSDVQGAIGIAQMRKIDSILSDRRRLASRLKTLIQEIPGVRLPRNEPETAPTFQSFVVMLPNLDIRDAVIRHLADSGVESTVGTYGLHLEPYFIKTMGDLRDRLPGATEAAECSLTLPLYPAMRLIDLERVASALAMAMDASS